MHFCAWETSVISFFSYFAIQLLVACTLASVSLAQRFRTQPDARLSFSLLNNEVEQTTPVPILRYIDTQNPDGSYTYGYESGDGTYKLETR